MLKLNSASGLRWKHPSGTAQFRKAFAANCVHNLTKLFDAPPKPAQFFFSDAIMFGVARFHISFFELFEARPVRLQLARPDINQPHVDTLGLGPQETKIVNVRGVERADEKNTMIQTLGSLMHKKCR